MARKNTPKSAKQNTVAQDHVQALYVELCKQRYKDSSLANRYVHLIRIIGMKLRLRLPREIKRSYCKHCYTAFAPGENCRVRLRKGMLVYSCFSCKRFTRLPYAKPKK